MSELKLDLEWRTTLVTLLLVPGLIWLGLWQLQRADEKVAIGSQWEQRKAMPPTPLPDVDPLDVAGMKYLPVALQGHFLPQRYFLLDNRIFKGKFGYEVLGLFALDNAEQIVLVNRGWIAGDSSRLLLPQVPPAQGFTSLDGHIYVPRELLFYWPMWRCSPVGQNVSRRLKWTNWVRPLRRRQGSPCSPMRCA